MLPKFEILNMMKKTGVVAVIRGHSEENSYKISKASIEGGVKAIELAFTSPDANVTIKSLNKEYANDASVIIGAGTVLDTATARIAIIAGAKFIVSPSYNSAVAKICNLYCIPYMPGCFTPTEVQRALMTGSDVIKVFPGAIATPKMISELQGPFPQVNIMPSGGVSLDNMASWFNAGAFVVGVGGSLVSPGTKGDYAQVKENAQKFRAVFEKISNN